MAESLITIPEIAEKYDADESQIRKVIKAAKINYSTVIRAKTNKSATAIATKDLAKLFKEMPSLVATKAKDTDVTVSQATKEIAKIRKWKHEDNITTVLKMAESNGIKVKERKVGGRLVKVFSKGDYDKLLKDVKETLVA